MDYSYPIDPDWTTSEIVDVIKFFELVEKGYEQGVKREDLLKSYRRFKEIVPGKAQEKKICNEFEEISGYSTYLLIKVCKESNENEMITMKKR